MSPLRVLQTMAHLAYLWHMVNPSTYALALVARMAAMVKVLRENGPRLLIAIGSLAIVDG
jgi:hypothetical protein